MVSSTAQRTILVPLDGSSFAEQALPLAIGIARTTGSRLALVLVQHHPLWPEETITPEAVAAAMSILQAEGETYLRAIQQRCQTPELEIATLTLPAELRPVGDVLNRYALDARIDLVVMATHGRGGVKRAWLGSVADYLVRHLHIPIVLTRPSGAPAAEGNRILVPLDGSPLAESVLEEACALASAGQHEITLLQVVQPVMRTVSVLEASYAGLDEELTAMHRSAAEDYLDDIKDRIRDLGIRCTGLTMLAPNTAEAIIELARPGSFRLIALASHGRGGLQRLMLGSVADKVVRGADVPVLV